MRTWLFGAGVAASLVFAQAASAGVVMPATVVSPNPSPFANCDNQGLAGINVNAEVEPWLAVDPENSNYAVAWQQDRWGNPNEGGAHGLVAWSSVSGKNSWAPFTTCSGGTAANNGNFDRASDVWLSYGPDGRLYQLALVFDQLTNTNGIAVSTSTDDGQTWSNPTIVVSSPQNSFTHGFDKESITADPTRSGVAYVVWDRFSNQKPDFSSGNGQNANKGPAYISTTTDGGKTWSAAKPIYTQDNGTLGNQLVVLEDGTLIDFFTNFVFSSQTGAFTEQLDSVRSTNGGNTWTKPIAVSDLRPNGTQDPRNGSFIRAGDSLFDVALGANGDLYAVWEDARFNGVDQVAFSKSTDGGSTWSTPVKISKTPANTNALLTQAFTPSIDVSDNGTIAVGYYDFRNFSGGQTLPTTYSAITSTDGGNSWGPEITLSTSDMEYAPVAGGLMIGDYEALAHSGNTFLTAFEVGNTASDPTDIAVASFKP
jgi:Neuraminidase (sialidase)